MPAIDLVRLRTKINLLTGLFSKPSDYVRGLREIFSVYSDRTRPLSNFHKEIHSLPAFNTPPLLNRELEEVLSEFSTDHPLELLGIIDELWQQPEIELRQLAAVLLGRLPVESEESVISRIVKWSEDQKDAPLLLYLHLHGSSEIRRHDPLTWMKVLESWKDSKEPWQIRLSIQGVISLIDDRNFSNLPSVFTFLAPLFGNLSHAIQHELFLALEHLVKRSEVETAYFLKQIVIKSRNPDLQRFVRRSLELFSLDNQNSLRSALRKQVT